MAKKNNEKTTIIDKKIAIKLIEEKINIFLTKNRVSLDDTAQKRLNEFEIDFNTDVTDYGDFISIDGNSGFWYTSLHLYKNGKSIFSIGNTPF